MLRQARNVRFEGRNGLGLNLFGLVSRQVSRWPVGRELIRAKSQHQNGERQLASPGSLERDHPRNLPNADSKAVTPISPAAQKFHLFILCSALDNSVTVSNSSLPGLMLGKRHIADVNQNIAEPHAAIITPVSMNDLIITPNGSDDRDYTANPNYHMVMSGFGP
jgi:hypothetical protein